MKPCTLIGSDKGGVGKSLVAQIVITAYDRALEEAASMNAGEGDERLRQPLKVVEIDFQHRLKAILGDRVDVSLDAAATMLNAKDKNSHAANFHSAYDVWSSGPSVTDLGANVTTPLMLWAQHADIGTFAKEDEIVFRFVSVTTPDDQALRSAFGAMKAARGALGEDTEVFLVFNDTQGTAGYRHFENEKVWSDLHASATAMNVNLIYLPFCDSELMDLARASGHTLMDLLKNGQEIANKQCSDRLTARIETKKFTDWAYEVQEQMAPVFAKPEPRRTAG